MENSATIDKINNFPDDIIGNILSFLPTKLAFATLALSKKWSPFCYSLIKAHFDDDSVKNKKSFKRLYRFVDTFILSPKVQNLTLKTFHLKCSSRYWRRGRYSNIKQWIEVAKRRCLEDLDLSMTAENTHNGSVLTPNIFNSPTLVVLKLSKLRMEDNINCVALPLLKTLHLKSVILRDSEDLKRLMNGCPLLKDLYTNVYYWKDGRIRPHGFQTLSKLVIADINSFDIPFTAISSVQQLRIVKYRERKDEAETDSYYNALSIFENLIHLEIEFYEFGHGWDDIMEMLQHCPKLRVLSIKKVITKGWVVNKSPYENWKCSNYVPECVESHLKSCSITSSCFLEDDLRFAAYILQNAKLLRALKIQSLEFLNSSEKQQQFSDELSSFSKASPECELSLKFSS